MATVVGRGRFRRSPIHAAYFVSNFVAMATGVSRGRIFVIIQ